MSRSLSPSPERVLALKPEMTGCWDAWSTESFDSGLVPLRPLAMTLFNPCPDARITSGSIGPVSFCMVILDKKICARGSTPSPDVKDYPGIELTWNARLSFEQYPTREAVWTKKVTAKTFIGEKWTILFDIGEYEASNLDIARGTEGNLDMSVELRQWHIPARVPARPATLDQVTSQLPTDEISVYGEKIPVALLTLLRQDEYWFDIIQRDADKGVAPLSREHRQAACALREILEGLDPLPKLKLGGFLFLATLVRDGFESMTPLQRTQFWTPAFYLLAVVAHDLGKRWKSIFVMSEDPEMLERETYTQCLKELQIHLDNVSENTAKRQKC